MIKCVVGRLDGLGDQFLREVTNIYSKTRFYKQAGKLLLLLLLLLDLLLLLLFSAIEFSLCDSCPYTGNTWG